MGANEQAMITVADGAPVGPDNKGKPTLILVFYAIFVKTFRYNSLNSLKISNVTNTSENICIEHGSAASQATAASSPSLSSRHVR